MALVGNFQGVDIPCEVSATVAKGVCVTQTTDGSTGNLRVAVAGTSDKVFGIATEDIASGAKGNIRVSGIALVKANTSVSLGARLCVAAATGLVGTLAANGEIVGLALHAATAQNDLIPCLLRQGWDDSVS